MKQPIGPPSILVDVADDWSDHWFTQGSMIGCAEPTGTNCNAESPCCASDQLAAPTLTSLDQLSYTNLTSTSDCVHVPAGTEAPSDGTFTPDGDKTIAVHRGAIAPSAGTFCQTYKLPGYKKMLNAEQKKSRSLRGRGDKIKSKIKSKSKSKDEKAFAAFVAKDPSRYNPWLSPGTAPIADPCGTLGGWDYPSARDYVAGPGPGFAAYMNGTGGPTNVQMPPAAMPVPAGSRGTAALLYDVNMRMQKAQSAAYDAAVGSDSNSNQKWVAGGAQEVSYTIVANHGGGVQWRLCPLSKLRKEGGRLTDECFARTPLDFVGDTAWLEYTGSNSNATNATDNASSTNGARVRVPYTPVRVSEATSGAKVSPAGSTWTKIGLPPCSGAAGGSGQGAGTHCAEPQFTNELTAAGFWGYGNGGSANSPALAAVQDTYSLVDTVRVPEGLEGDFVVQWRWDSEQTAQVWTQCAVVTIEKASN